VEEFVYLGADIHSSTHRSPDILWHGAFTNTTAMDSWITRSGAHTSELQ